MSHRPPRPIMDERPFVPPPGRPVWWLRPLLGIAARIAGKEPLPARLLAHAPKLALGAGLLEALTAHAPADLDGRTLAVARLVASATAGCPFCVDMNAAGWQASGLTRQELSWLLDGDEAACERLGRREALAARYARALSRTPIVVEPGLIEQLRSHFSERELVTLAATIAQVNFWSRFNQGLGVPSSGFFDEKQGCDAGVRPSSRRPD